MVGKTIRILQEFDPARDYGVHIRPQIKRILSELQFGQTYLLSELVRKYDGNITKTKNLKNTQDVFKHVMKIGKQIGLIGEVQTAPISFSDFCKLDTVSYMRRQLKETRFKNKMATTKHGGGGTKRSYSLHLWHFSNWLKGKTITTQTVTPLSKDTQKITTTQNTLDSIEDLIKLYQDSITKGPEFIRIIKEYLMDDIHKNKSQGYMKNIISAIKAYFEKNESSITFRFNVGVDHDNSERISTMSLHDLMELLTSGRPSVVQKAVIMCKFQGGLDNATFVDRFNFEAWPQLVKWFGSSEYSEWNLSKCPAIIHVTRIKVGFPHICLLEKDAIVSLQKALDWRLKKTNSAIKKGEAMLLNERGDPITDRWVSELLPKLAEKAQIQKKFEGKSVKLNEKVSHELRDLLKSTLHASGVATYAANHVIGHMPQDSYEKEQILYPQKIRQEYMKASKLLNIFSKFSSVVEGTDDVDELKSELSDALQKIKEHQKEKSKQQADMIDIQEQLVSLQHEVGMLRKGARSDEKALRAANSILYKNRNKIPKLSMKSIDDKYLIKDNDLERNYGKIFEIDSYWSKIEKSK